ncbi:FAD:protein FMN transferase [Streptosporangium pseudovulgare]|uniref:FAD:protein FMN transferase n=1 Tax=Streptosporangium pseudovulgare TaxID=35765 RepID=A0ABQ2R0K4_9ACTN|nr:FAD:protein FMN transferase [Streptosporangium pseudovulgare]GGQ06943.1 FAD:protein FMN transferase [Streptosporangium pseudovulgare]
MTVPHVSAGVRPAATRHVEHVMGTVFSFDVRHAHGAGDAETAAETAAGAVAEAVAWLHRVDEVFSTYRPGSFVSRLDRGEIGPADCPPEVTEVLGLCEAVAGTSLGYFTARPGGRLDPSGLVKGWAIERASRILTRAGAVNHCVNGGGDIQLAGTAAPGRPWRVGVAHPLRPGDLATVVTGGVPASAVTGSRPAIPATGSGPVTVVTGGDSVALVTSATGSDPADATAGGLAVATSGTAERGTHIVDPHTGRPAAGLVSVTLVGASLTLVDAYATAAFAMGGAAREWVEGLDGVEAFAVTASGDTWRTSGFPGAAPPAVR